jgi:hypothetical protein
MTMKLAKALSLFTLVSVAAWAQVNWASRSQPALHHDDGGHF